MIYITFLLIIIFFILLTYYLSIRISNIFWKQKATKKQILLVCIIQIFFFIIYFSKISFFKIISSYYMAFIFYFFFFSLFFDLLQLLFKKGKFFKEKENVITGFRVILPILIVVLGHINALNTKITTYQLTTEKEISPVHIVLLSDLHLSYATKSESIKELVKKVNDLSPDFIFITGDIFDGDDQLVKNLNQIKDYLKELNPKLGTYSILGNHDLRVSKENIKAFCNDSNITLLEDEIITLDHFQIIGRLESNHQNRQKLSSIIEQIDFSKYTILLDHEPTDIKESVDSSIDLHLSGHTHHGQLFPANFITNLLFLVDYGHEKIHSTDIIVTSGVGFWGPPIRVGNRSEIVNIILEPKK